MSDAVGRRIRMVAGLLVLAELVVYVLVVNWIGLAWTILATLATSALGMALLARQGTRALTELRDRARSRRSAGRELGDAGLVAAGGLLMVLPGFIGDLVGLLCLLPGTRGLVRALLTRFVLARVPGMRGAVRVRSVRTAEVPRTDEPRTDGPRTRPLVIEGEVVRDPDGRPLR
ncbi:MAG: FxsA cytoplasmic membrane protein [uncultured Blastococcus sp.]|uniref:FxsA cytoplasmic membrane protein n=1 Tax=uncultured Blastococcus sp. TaxID=217144 RepID=A0A6J4J3E3_9ACTN|nr:MAG: FxsA cytoplasmic membrane protein [uncultured Blastococcus sp.]